MLGGGESAPSDRAECAGSTQGERIASPEVPLGSSGMGSGSSLQLETPSWISQVRGGVGKHMCKHQPSAQANADWPASTDSLDIFSTPSLVITLLPKRASWVKQDSAKILSHH